MPVLCNLGLNIFNVTDTSSETKIVFLNRSLIWSRN